MPNDTTTPSILDAAGLSAAASPAAPAATSDATLAAALGAILGELKALRATPPATFQAQPAAFQPAPPAAPPPPPPLHPLFGRRCRYEGGLAFVTRVYSERDLTDPMNGRRLADPANGEMVDLLAFDANASARPVKSVHIADSDWAE